MWAFSAVCKIMILVRCPVLREYWDRHSPAYNKTIAEIMRRDQFEAILTNMHFADRATDYPTGEHDLPREGRLPAGERNWDIQGYQDLLTTAWQLAADYTQTCALDEKGYRTKSKRMPGKQRNIAKPARYFIKAFAVAASDRPLRGYVYNISMLVWRGGRWGR